jgi:hypothetical protein
MKKKLSTLAMALVLLSLAVQGSWAQDAGVPVVIIQGTPDAAANPPEVSFFVSVVDPEVGGSIEGLGAADFAIKEEGIDKETLSASYESVGMAIVIVVDRGGISAMGDRNSVSDPSKGRIWDASGLGTALLDDSLVFSAESNDDMVAVVGIGTGGTLEPKVDFTYNPVDKNGVRNEIERMREMSVEGGTPLYDGLDEALRMLREPSDPAIAAELAHRRKVIIVFSDGIDPDYSDTTAEEDIIRKAQEADISLYAIGMAHRDQEGLSGERNLKRLGAQTKGLYRLHNDDASHQDVLDTFDRVATQRHQYRLAYETRLPKRESSLQVTVRNATDEAEFASVLEPPQLSLSAPPDGGSYTVPISYDEVTCLYIDTKRENYRYETATTIPMSVQVVSVDGASREPAEVRYFANGVLIGTSASAPNYDFVWDVTSVYTPTEQVREEKYTLTARAEDDYLGERMDSQEVTVAVTWEAAEQTNCVEWERRVNESWWIACIVGVLALAILALLIMLIRTRGKIGQMARRVASNTTGVLKGITKRLGALPQQTPGKLVVLQGANMGREFRLALPIIKVGRDPQFCDLALHDDFVSNPHFTIRLEQTQFYIIDEGSTNGTRLNGVPIAPQKRMLLQPDAIIEVGSTRLQFKRLGGTTRQLGHGVPHAPSAPQAPQAPPGAPSHPPAQPQGMPPAGHARRMPPPPPVAPPPSPAAPPPQPPPAPSRGGPTVKLPDEESQAGPRGGPTVKLQDEEPQAGQRGGPAVRLQDEESQAGQRGGPTVKLQDEEPQAGQRGGPTVKLQDEEPQAGERGGPTVKLQDEEPQAGQRGGPTVKLQDEEPQAGQRGGPTVKLQDEESQTGQRGGPTVKLPEDEGQEQ